MKIVHVFDVEKKASERRCLRCDLPFLIGWDVKGHMAVFLGQEGYGDYSEASGYVRCDPSMGALYEVMLA